MGEGKNKIPKIIHYCWFGGNPMPDSFQKCIDSWKQVMPEYEIVCWDEKNFDLTSVSFVREAAEMKKWAFVSDYVRLYALYHQGGIYLDTDVEIVQCLDRFLVHSFFSGFETKTRVAGSLIAAEKGNGFVKELLEYYTDRPFIKPDGKLDMKANPKIIMEFAQKRGLKAQNEYQMLEEDIHYYPTQFFSPTYYNYDQTKAKPCQDTYAIHQFAGTWVKRGRYPKLNRRLKCFRWQVKNLIGENTYFKFKESLGFSNKHSKKELEEEYD